VTAPAPAQQPVIVAGVSLRRILLVIGTVLFVIAAFAAGGDPLGNIGEWCWAFGAFAAWILSGAVP
jgi:hypothetical protein